MTPLRYGARALATAAPAIGTLAATGAAAYADPPMHRCAKTAPGFVLGSSQYGSAWVTTGSFYANYYNDFGLLTNCEYVGEEYSWTVGGTTVDEGRYYFWRPLFIP